MIGAFDEAVSRTPLIKCDLQLYTDEDISLENVTILKTTTSAASTKGNTVTIVMDSTSNETDEILHSIEEKSFLLVRKIGNTTFTEVPPNFNMITGIAFKKKVYNAWNSKMEILFLHLFQRFQLKVKHLFCCSENN